jgi:hypothetical protein
MLVRTRIRFFHRILPEPVRPEKRMLLYTAIFFALAFLYVKACQKLR